MNEVAGYLVSKYTYIVEFQDVNFRQEFAMHDAKKQNLTKGCTSVSLVSIHIIDRELRSGLSMSFTLLLLSAMHSVRFLSCIRKPEILSWIRKPESLMLDKKTKKSYLG